MLNSSFTFPHQTSRTACIRPAKDKRNWRVKESAPQLAEQQKKGSPTNTWNVRCKGCKGWMDQEQLLTLKLQRQGWWGRKIIFLLVHRKEWCFETAPKGTCIAKRVGGWDKLCTQNEGFWWHGKTFFLYRQDLLRPHFWKSLSFQLHWFMAHIPTPLMMQDLPSWEHIPPFKRVFRTGYLSRSFPWRVGSAMSCPAVSTGLRSQRRTLTPSLFNTATVTDK